MNEVQAQWTENLGATPEMMLSLCSFMVGERLFGIDTRTIKEVLGKRAVRRVPLAAAFVGGIVPYRGEVLTTVSFRSLVGLEPREGPSYVIVVHDAESGDRFGLMVDSVAGVVIVDRRTHEGNPSTLEERSGLLYDGVYRVAGGLLIQLTPGKLRPTRLWETGLFGRSVLLSRFLPINPLSPSSAAAKGTHGAEPVERDRIL